MISVPRNFWNLALGTGKLPESVPSVVAPQAANAKARVPAVLAMVAVLLLGLGGWWWLAGAGDISIFSAAPGGLVLTSEPSGAGVFDSGGAELGVTPLELKGLPGGQAWEGHLELPDYIAVELREEVMEGETRLASPVKLQAQPQKVTVTSEPAGADVLEDEKVLGVTPWESEPREVGSEVALTLRLPGYEEEALGGKVELGNTLMLEGKLRPRPQKVTVTSEPTGAEVLEGGKSLGKTPFVLTAVSPGTAVSYQLRLEAYEEAGLAGRVEVGEPLVLEVTLKPLPKPKFIGSNPGEEKLLEIAPGVNMTFCWIPPGEFLMGSPAGELGRMSSEVQHLVKISKGFWLAKTETTQAQWRAVMGSNPSHFRGDDLPVESVSWNDIAGPDGFMEKVNQAAAAGVGEFSLPTEAQWEYACRAGTTGPHAGDLDQMAWYSANSGRKTQPVGRKKANAWGLQDMHGNVWERCADWYAAYPPGPVTDPLGAASGAFRVVRGGGWILVADDCRVAFRSYDDPTVSGSGIGFRVARSSVP
jgi:formylglycine-generating enzyme required for sulfatase activity